MTTGRTKQAVTGLFTLSGSPYSGNAKMEGRPLRPEELFLVLDLKRPGLEAVMAFGRWLMTDPGVFNYKGGDPGREAFRRTAAHQRLTLNGANAARAGKCLQWIEDDGRGNAVLTVENASYPGLTHRRTVFFVQRRWFVLVDEALGAAARSCSRAPIEATHGGCGAL